MSTSAGRASAGGAALASARSARRVSTRSRTLGAMFSAAARSRERIAESELSLERFVPYVRHVDERTVALDSGAVMRMWRLNGLPAESLDQVVVNQMAIAHNHALRAMATERAALWTHLVRLRQPALEPLRVRTTPFIDELVEDYEASLAGERLYKNTFLVSLVVLPQAMP